MSREAPPVLGQPGSVGWQHGKWREARQRTRKTYPSSLKAKVALKETRETRRLRSASSRRRRRRAYPRLLAERGGRINHFSLPRNEQPLRGRRAQILEEPVEALQGLRRRHNRLWLIERVRSWFPRQVPRALPAL